MKVRVGDLVSPKRGRRTCWVGLVIEQREMPSTNDPKSGMDCLVQWTRYPHSPAWWVDWSLEVVNESR